MIHNRTWLWLPALALLALVLALVNLPAQSSVPEIPDTDGQVADFSVACTDGSVFTLSEQRGRVVIVNLWATWCTPCVEELPEFERFAKENPDTVTVLALHSSLVTEDVAAFAARRGLTLRIAVAPEETLFDALCDGDVLPQTIVLAPDGTILARRIGSLDAEALAALVAQSEGLWN